MNYQHAYHAGNFADCFKHALLIALLDCMTRKATPLFVLDTHAGAGRYDLTSPESERTNEAADGILRLMGSDAPKLVRFLNVVDALGPGREWYPGSPCIIRHLLRPNDRMDCCEAQTDVAATLRTVFREDPIVHVHQRSGWEALGALLPPAEKRGLIFIDPPYEQTDEFDILVDGMKRCHARFRQGVLAAWYPLKRQTEVRRFYSLVQQSRIRDIVAIEMHLRTPTDVSRFDGCGMIVINPPYQFAQEAQAIAGAIVETIGSQEDGGHAKQIELVDE